MTLAHRATAAEDLPVMMEEGARFRLAKVGYRSLHTVTCHSQQGELILRGCVSTYYEKQLAQESLRTLMDKVTIRNEITVS